MSLTIDGKWATSASDSHQALRTDYQERQGYNVLRSRKHIFQLFTEATASRFGASLAEKRKEKQAGGDKCSPQQVKEKKKKDGRVYRIVSEPSSCAASPEKLRWSQLE